MNRLNWGISLIAVLFVIVGTRAQITDFFDNPDNISDFASVEKNSITITYQSLRTLTTHTGIIPISLSEILVYTPAQTSHILKTSTRRRATMILDSIYIDASVNVYTDYLSFFESKEGVMTMVDFQPV